MASISALDQPLSDSEHRGQLTRAVVAATIGTTIEWYDFFLYSTVTGLVFAKLYFPNSDPLIGTLNAFGIYAVGFIARPVGAAVFGHYGDRIGRKSTLIATLILMGLATFFVAFVPSYERIGVWGAVILTMLRFLQGVGVGGEWGGSVLLAMEWAKTNKHRGFVASWPQFGVPAGLFLANLAVIVCSRLTGDEFLDWGWRIPFFISIVLVALGLWISPRHPGNADLPAYRGREPDREGAGHRGVSPATVRDLPIGLPAHGRAGALLYLHRLRLHLLRQHAEGRSERRANAVLCAAALSFISVPLFGHLSDRIGRKRMYMIGAVVTALYGFAYFYLLDTTSPTLIFIAIFLSLVPHDMMYGPQAALIAELFTGRLRYTGASLGYQLASIIAGGPAPLIAVWLLGQYGTGYAIAGFIAACGVISLIATATVKDYTGEDIAAEYDKV